MQFTIYFDPPFWVGVLEDERDGQLYAARHVFGAEPNNQQVYTFVLHELDTLCCQMTVGVPAETHMHRRVNPKRQQREARRAVERQGITSKAHEVMRVQREQNKKTRKEVSRAQRETERERTYQTRREKARKKHRGR
ncbi:MAG: YjdF family protein [Anaerolineae bacterium]|nr:YjdF family protein [Anaerolineae bacterium]